MDSQKKQKVILALVAVLVLGAGSSFWFFGRDSSSAASKTGNTGPAVRRVRDTTDDKGKARNTRRVRARKEKAPVQVRAERKVAEKKSTRRKARGRGAKKVKKAKKAPAA